MSPYRLLDDLELKVRTGRGAAVIVEGETEQDDPFIYGVWFGNLAPEVTFFPQDGWAKVIVAVTELRRRCPGVPVYGIVDRDFTDEDQLGADFPTLGILRTTRYTLENYLLEPECWASVFRYIFRPFGGPPDGWGEPEQVAERIAEAYRSCIELSAHNRVVKYGCDTHPGPAAASDEGLRTYREHPNALMPFNVEEKLRSWGAQIGCAQDLGAMYLDERERLANGGLSLWHQHISGKYVLGVFHHQFPRRRGKGQFDLDHYLNEYLRACYDPPDDLTRLLSTIIADANK